jgi:hypothetical protein
MLILMSAEEDKSKESKTITHKMEISTSEKEREISKQKDDILEQKAKLEKELEFIKNQYNSAVTDLEKANKDVELTAKERDDLKSKYTEIAMTRYNAEKDALITQAKNVLPAEKITEMEKQIDSPEKLDKMKWMVTSLVEQLAEGKKAHQETQENKTPLPPNPENKGAGGSGNATMEQPKTFISTDDFMKKPFNSKKELVDYLYDLVERGEVVERTISDGKGGTRTVEERVGPNVKAEQALVELWKKHFNSEKNAASGKKTFVMCPSCKGLYDANSGTCPLCKVSLTKGPNIDEHNIRVIS